MCGHLWPVSLSVVLQKCRLTDTRSHSVDQSSGPTLRLFVSYTDLTSITHSTPDLWLPSSSRPHADAPAARNLSHSGPFIFFRIAQKFNAKINIYAEFFIVRCTTKVFLPPVFSSASFWCVGILCGRQNAVNVPAGVAETIHAGIASFQFPVVEANHCGLTLSRTIEIPIQWPMSQTPSIIGVYCVIPYTIHVNILPVNFRSLWRDGCIQPVWPHHLSRSIAGVSVVRDLSRKEFTKRQVLSLECRNGQITKTFSVVKG